MLHVNNLTFRYGANVVLNDLSLHLSRGQIGLLVGENGAGKSTLLRCLAGWTRVHKGTIYVNGVSSQEQEQEYRKHILLVPDTPDFYDELTAWEHLQFVAQLHRLVDWRETAACLLQDFRLLDHKDALPFTFSRGMRYKLALCLALLVSPPLLLFDEPFASLDALAGQTLWRILRAHADRGGVALYSSHALLSDERPDLFLHLHQGQIGLVASSNNNDVADLLRNVND